ncbi:hypothetical protein ILUMI_11397 [Ignelater luminosus]|uniref:Major facilitator superfamily associated domain-containing protein n=1 Tax=Ignelater luminosus TaxID=2038154 RepID=A0A8K0GAJ4_IGNLU|nr:hypothetical protein ILUMI_11397 [Ignelater luminosus]
MKYINRNLITLKFVLFLFFGGIGCIYPFLPLHMTAKGLSVDEKKIVSLVAPCIALLGPAVAGPLADKLAGGTGGTPRSKTGKYLRVMIAICFILSAILYWLLMVVPTIVRNHHSTTVGLVCGSAGGEIIVEKCIPGKPCSEWEAEGIAIFHVTNCTYSCETVSYHPTTITPEQDTSASADYEEHYDEAAIGSGEGPIEAFYSKNSNATHSKHTPLQHVPHPHLCYTNEENQTYCHVYSLHSKPVRLRVPLKRLSNESNSGVCKYPISGDFHCRMGPQFDHNNTIDLNSACNPIIKCIVHNPYNKSNSVFIESACSVNTSSFWWYLVIRSIADIFPAAAVALLGAAIIIATRETSTGRGDVGKQFAVGALGLAIFAPIIGAIDSFIVAFSIYSVFMVIGALILLIDYNMPLSPPEWWWHTRCGLLAVPMSSIRKYGLEIAALALVLLLLGIFWNGIDPYLPWHIIDMSGDGVNIGLTITVGALPAVLFFIFIEKIVDYCGHTNLLIAAFAFYIIHYTALSCIECPWLLLLCEALEIFTLHITWVTAVLYLRHLVPRRFTASGQALPVITHFCLGRLIGGLIGGLAYPRTKYRVVEVYEGFASAAAIIAIIYFSLYHFYLKPKYAAPVAEAERPSPALIQSVNGNGAYTPLRVYHNGKAKKGQFKY